MSNKGYTRPKTLIGIGASAGGLEPLQDLLTHLSAKISDAAIIVAQHLSPNYKSMLVELLARKTKIPVLEAKSGLRIETNHIYTIPPDNDLVIQDDYIQLKKIPELSPKPSINVLFESIANEYGKDSVGIILSGTGQDGAKGIELIKAKGGVTIVQLPASAKYDGMPNAAINTGKVDHIMSPKFIGEKFSKLITKKKIKVPNLVQKKKEPVTQLLEMMEDRVGTDFSNYKTSTIYRRLEKRMSDKKVSNIEDYLQLIYNSPDELDNLFQYMLIGVTSFFRNPEVFDVLNRILEEIIINKYKDESLRIWIPGCASGEEAYTIAILVSEAMNNSRFPKINVQIFATDIDQNALSAARNGVYDASKTENIPKHILEEYFIKRGDKYELISKIKKMILFSRHDVLNNPPFLRVDLISCRNMLIYFDQSLQKQLLPIFHYALNNEGFLLLGKSESVGHLKNLFSTVDGKNKIYQRKAADSKMIKFPHSKPILPKKMGTITKITKKDNLSVGDMVKETFYNSIEYPYVVIDDTMDMVEIQGDVSKYLAFRQGAVNMNILKQINNDLQIELRAVITKAVSKGESVKGNLKRIKDKAGKAHFIRFVVKPLMYSKPNNPYYLVIFENYDFDDALIQFATPTTSEETDPKMLQLEQELEATKEHMNTLIEELEASNEELQALNEELQSSNEELQASNEELETSNEELQATNEELETAYAEINAAAEEIEKQNEKIKESENNLKTIFNSTLQAFILVDKNYNVLTYNYTAEKIYKEIFGKNIAIGNSYVDLIPNEYFPNFRDSFKKALEGKTVAFEELVVNKKNQNRYLIYNYTPVEKDNPGDKDYVCISFIDDTARVTAEKELKVAHQETQKQKNLWEELSLTSPDLIAILRSEDFVYEFVNPAYKQLFPQEELIGHTFFDMMPDLKEKGFIDILNGVKKGKPYRISETEAIINNNYGKASHRYFNITYAPLKTEKEDHDIIIYATDVTDQVISRKDLESAHKEIEVQKNRLEDLITNAPASIAVTKGETHVIEYINPQFKEVIGNRKVIDKKLDAIISKKSLEKLIPLLDEVYKSGAPYISREVQSDIFKTGKKKDKEIHYYTFIFQPWKDASNITKGIIIYAFDVTDQVQARKQIENTMQHFRVLTDAMPQNVWTADQKGKFDYLNKNFTRFLGVGNNRHNINWMKFVHPDDYDETIKLWDKAIKRSTDFQIQHRIKAHDNTYKWHLTRGVPYFDEENNNIIKWIGTTTDIHEQKSTEALKEEFISIASHELKTPLTTLKAYFDLLHMHIMQVGDHNSKEYIEKSVEHVNKLNSLIGDLLDVSRIEGGKINFALEEIDFDKFVEENIQSLRHTTKSHKITLEGSTNSIIKGDKKRLEQVFTNLISNAIKYSPDSKEVNVKVEKDSNGSVITTVRDHGIGIPAEKLNRIFDRFYRVSEENSFVSGLGIGLYITKEIIRRHNGEIWAESEENKGSSFNFSLPVTKN